MKIVGATRPDIKTAPTLGIKNFSTLLELIKPLSPTQALVKTELLGELTLYIKQPLDKGKLYHGYIELKDKVFTLKESSLLPAFVKDPKTKALALPIEQFIHKLKLGISPQKIQLESLTQQLQHTQNSDEIKDILSHIVHLAQMKEVLLPLAFKDDYGYVRFKKPELHEDKKRLDFEAYFTQLGIIEGYVSQNKTLSSVHIFVENQNTKTFLSDYKETLKLKIFIEIKIKEPQISSQSILDIKA